MSLKNFKKLFLIISSFSIIACSQSQGSGSKASSDSLAYLSGGAGEWVLKIDNFTINQTNFNNALLSYYQDVKYTNNCHISIHQNYRKNKIIIVSVIDNMVKGAAGQAIQNMNLLLDLPQNTGLKLIAPSF